MEINLKKISPEDIDGCVELFINVFNSAPWNDQWTKDKAKVLFEDFINTPGFIGYYGSHEKKSLQCVSGMQGNGGIHRSII
ncbi:MAG: hypothetical protein JW874_13960 [Spirochaetales bacterium]|nr:hypothetical protein [Spirochaetales bacterium]